jgi:hypothetical protein
MNNVNKARMNHDGFLRFVEGDRGCGEGKLDAAVNAGLRRARTQSGRVDSRPLLMLAAASVFTLVLCFTTQLRMFEPVSEQYYQARNKTMPGAGAALDTYAKDIAEKIGTIAGHSFR